MPTKNWIIKVINIFALVSAILAMIFPQANFTFYSFGENGIKTTYIYLNWLIFSVLLLAVASIINLSSKKK